MEEDEPDYKTPIGKVIKRINTLCKKPQIDEELSEVLDLFNEKLDEQEKYLINGIFKINFSEAALFLQSSAELYGKKIDLLWDQLLEFHTRLIKYDCEHQREKGAAVDKEVIEKLEERRNRYKRKKKFKLLLQTSDVQKLTTLLFDSEKEGKGATQDGYDSSDDESGRMWREFESKSTEMRKIPCIVYKQMMQTYRLKNYHILKCQDFDLFDLEDDEFNTKYSRVPGWHHTLHLFEYNRRGLLPDNNNIIARLRLTAYKRIRFLISRKIPLNTPFEQYKDEYMAYRKQFFEEEAKKWQNMPLNTLEDLRKQLQYLAQREREENGETTTNDDNSKLGRYGIKDTTRETSIDKINLLDNSDEDSLFELSFTCDNEFMKSDLFVRLEKLSSDLINTKLRQDSGFFDFNSDSDDDCNNAVPADGHSSESVIGTNDVPAVISSDNIGVTNDTENVIDGENTTEAINDVNANNVDGTIPNSSMDNGLTNNSTVIDPAADFDDTRSYISDHDYCLTAPLLEPSKNSLNCVNEASPSMTRTIDLKGYINIVKDMRRETVIEPTFAKPRMVQRIIKMVQKKTTKITSDDDVSPPKRRKLSAKQMEKLLQSKVKAVKELKFEKFFSMNYQPQMGEGEVQVVDYESGESDTENVDDIPLNDDDIPLNDDDVVRPVQDDNQSIMSDHDYCQNTTEDSHNDSGFIDASNISSSPENESTRVTSQENIPENTDTPQINTIDLDTISLEDEYEKLLAMLNESKKNGDKSNQNDNSKQEQDRREKERMESQARVEEWRNSITPILRNLNENDFDIHEYGSRIMENIDVDEPQPFSNIVKGKTSAEVVRYFISSLQLANTCNIEICGAQRGKLSNDTFKLKLLTKDRYHEHLDEYLAPSEETFREKLERVRAMTAASKQANSGEPPAKKQKFTNTSKGKRSRNNMRKTSSKTSSTDNAQTSSPQGNELSQDKNVDNSAQQSQTHIPSEAAINRGEVQDENNDALNTYQNRSLSKGKSIVRRPVMSETSHFHNIDISMPSTSRHYDMMYHRSIDDQMPSTSSSPDIDLSRFYQNYSSPNARTSQPGESPAKRKRNSSEDSFRDRFMAAQGRNPDIPLQSTPHGPPPSRQPKTTPPQKSIRFE